MLNPSFDVTPGELVTAFITERGLIEPPYETSLLEAQPQKAVTRTGANCR